MQRQRACERETSSSVGKGHGRIERRTLTSSTGLQEYLDWPGAQQVCRVVRQRSVRGEHTTEAAYYVTSLRPTQVGSADLEAMVRDHWGATENGLHWVRDEVLGEDRSTIFRGHAPQNLAALRNGMLNWLRREGHVKLAATLRSFARNPFRLFTRLGYPN